MPVTKSNYFSKGNQLKYCGASQYKNFMKCSAAALAELRGEWSREDTTALLVGSYVDAWFEGTLDAFKAEHPEILKRDGSLKADYEHADRIIERVQKDELFVKYMSGKKQVVKTGYIAGVPFKIKIDSYHKHKMLVDLKVVKDMKAIYDEEEGFKKDFIHYWGYEYQAAIYQAVEGENLPFYLCVVTKEREPDMAIIEIPQSWIDGALLDVERNAEMIDMIKHGELPPIRCEKCEYCRRTKRLTAPISAEELFEEVVGV